MELLAVPGAISVRESSQQSRGILQKQAFRRDRDGNGISVGMNRGRGESGAVLDLKEEIECYGN
jgi:hypothetical protein